MYWSHSRELLGEARSRRSKAAASSGCRLGSISSASRCSSAFSAAFFSRSSSCRDFFWDWQMVAAENVQVTDESDNARIRDDGVCYHPLHLVAFVLFLFVAGLALLRCSSRLQGAQSHIPGEARSHLQPGRPRRAARHLLRQMNSTFQIQDKEMNSLTEKHGLLQTEPEAFYLERHRPLL